MILNMIKEILSLKEEIELTDFIGVNTLIFIFNKSTNKWVCEDIYIGDIQEVNLELTEEELTSKIIDEKWELVENIL